MQFFKNSEGNCWFSPSEAIECVRYLTGRIQFKQKPCNVSLPIPVPGLHCKAEI